MYLEYFELSELPFTLTPNTNFFCALEAYNSALNLVKVSLGNGEGFVKIVGEVGTGKTLLCRKLLNELDPEQFVTAYIANPTLDHATLYEVILSELDVKLPKKSLKSHELLQLLNNTLLELYKKHKHVVVLIDEAQNLPDEMLEAVRLLSNIETESSKLLHIVLFGQPELDKRLAQRKLRQLRQRIAFSYYLKPLCKLELEDYVYFRLNAAGYKYGTLFSDSALSLLAKASAGIPRLINILCHKSLLAAYGYNKKKVTTKSVLLAIKDTDSVWVILRKNLIKFLALASLAVLFCAELFYIIRLI
jgi:MSHA biogenesis protein MshM